MMAAAAHVPSAGGEEDEAARAARKAAKKAAKREAKAKAAAEAGGEVRAWVLMSTRSLWVSDVATLHHRSRISTTSTTTTMTRSEAPLRCMRSYGL
jgi:hypothetical protein